jgi:copper(I)-binding protein
MKAHLTALLLAITALPAQAALKAEDAWIRAAPPGATALAGYVTLVNDGKMAVHCDGAHGADFGAAELHRTVVENGVSRMLRDQVLEVPAGGRASLAPGGAHIMLFRPARDLREGDQVTVTLECGTQSVDAAFRVRRGD